MDFGVLLFAWQDFFTLPLIIFPKQNLSKKSGFGLFIGAYFF